MISDSGSRKCVVELSSRVYQLLSKNNYLMTLFSPGWACFACDAFVRNGSVDCVG